MKNPIIDETHQHYKMYKSGRQWVFASIAALTMLTAAGSVAHADQTDQTTHQITVSGSANGSDASQNSDSSSAADSSAASQTSAAASSASQASAESTASVLKRLLKVLLQLPVPLPAPPFKPAQLLNQLRLLHPASALIVPTMRFKARLPLRPVMLHPVPAK